MSPLADPAWYEPAGPTVTRGGHCHPCLLRPRLIAHVEFTNGLHRNHARPQPSSSVSTTPTASTPRPLPPRLRCAALIRATARLLKLVNITFAGDHVLIDGKLGEYSLHLGSGTATGIGCGRASLLGQLRVGARDRAPVRGPRDA